jgi:uncharacterized protein
MPTARTCPGVDIQEIPSEVRSITGVATSITAFVGRTRRGPVNRPVQIRSYADFQRCFGGLWRESTLSYAVQHYFMNGGADAIIVRVFNNDGEADGDAGLTATYTLEGATGLVLAAASPGTWGDNLEIFVDHAVADTSDPTLFNITVNEVVGGGIRVSEVFRNLSISPASPRFVTTVLEQQSGLVRVSGTVPDDRPALNTVTDGVPEPATRSQQGGDGIAVGFDQIAHPDLAGSRQGIWALDHADTFNLLCIPPFTRLVDVTRETWTAAVTYCRTRRAMLIVDPPSDWTTADDVMDGTIGIDGTASAVPARDANASVYFPRIRMADPLEENRLETFAPCGVIAGIHSRTDAQRGVWKAPAGQDAIMVGVQELAYRMTDGENGRLNPLAVNGLRTFPARGNVVWGARTMQGADRLTTEWKYIPQRRLALHLEESLDRGTRWVVFEPNGEPLWSQIRLNVGAFMHDLFRQGAFQGRTPREAYFVKCDAETTTQNDIDRGIVNFSVGFAPLRPAEFLIIRISQVAGDIQT